MELGSSEHLLTMDSDNFNLFKSLVLNVSENGSFLNITISEETRIEKYLGVRYMDRWELALLNLVYISLFISGILGNIFTCVVVAKNRYMHTATNCYLFSLAVSDILILVLGK